jgi:drug/metabolite transporter (DMT)-like permease
MLIGEFLALAVAVFWTFTVVFFTDASNEIGPFQVNVNRIILSGIYDIIFIFLTGRSFLINPQQIFLLGISGIIGLVIGDTFLFKSFITIGPALSMLIMSLSPIITTILGIFLLKEYLSFGAILGIILTISGILLVVYKHNDNEENKFKISLKGIIFAIIAAFGQSLGFILSKEAFLISELDGFVAAFYRILVSAFAFLIIGIFTKKYKNPINLFKNHRKAFLFTSIGAVTGPFLGISLSLLSLKFTSAGISSTIMAIVPILLLPIQKYCYKENLQLKAIIGAIITVLGTTLLFIK